MADTWLQNRLQDTLGQFVVVGSHVVLDHEVSSEAVRLFMLLRLIAGPRTWLLCTLRDIANIAGHDEKTVRSYRDELRDRGLLSTRQVPGEGLLWTFLPPCEPLMAEVFDVMRGGGNPSAEQGPGTEAGGDAHLAEAALPRPWGQPYPAHRGSAAAGQRGPTTDEKKERTPNQTRHQATSLVPGVPDQMIIAVALASRIDGLVRAAGGDRFRERGQQVVTSAEVLPWLEAGLSWQRVDALFREWLAQLSAPAKDASGRDWCAPDSPEFLSDVDDAVEEAFHLSRERQLFLESSGKRIWNRFNEWALRGGALT